MNFENYDFGEILTRLGITYKENDSSYKANCPNPTHKDKNPSWSMDKKSGLHYCFSCGYKGNIISLVKDITGKSISTFLGLSHSSRFSLNPVIFNQHTNISPQKVRKIKPKVNIDGNLYSIPDNPKVHDYFVSIGGNLDFIDFFDIKYCKYVTINFPYPEFIDRIIFPIKVNNRVMSVEGRDFTGKQNPKVLYPKGGTTNTLWNIDNLDPSKPVIVCEGIKDTIKIWTHFSKNVTSTFGSQITNKQKELLLKYPDIVVFPDNDEAGLKMIDTLDDLLDYEFKIALPPKKGQDPNDLTLKEIEYILSNPVKVTEFFVNQSGAFDNL